MAVQTGRRKQADTLKQFGDVNTQSASDGEITETELSYEQQLQEFAEAINRGRKTKTRSRIVYTNEIREKINTLYKLGVKTDTIQSLYLSHLFYCGKTAIIIDTDQEIFRPMLDWAVQDEYDSAVLKAIIDWLNSDENLVGLNLLELMTSIRELFDNHGEWSHSIQYTYKKSETYKPVVFATTTLEDDTGVNLTIPVIYDASVKKYVLKIKLRYIYVGCYGDHIREEHIESDGFEINANNEGFDEFRAKFTEILKTYNRHSWGW